jgi:hypothetical protein
VGTGAVVQRPRVDSVFSVCISLPIHHPNHAPPPQAYTSQMVAITMFALALSEDSISKRALRDAIIDGLGLLSDAIRKVWNDSPGAPAGPADVIDRPSTILF